MSLILNIIMTLALAASVGFSTVLAVSAYLRKSKYRPLPDTGKTVDINKFNCRVTPFEDSESNRQNLKIEISGTINAPADRHETTVRIFASDITNGIYKAASVHGDEQFCIKNSPLFCCTLDLGSLPKSQTVLNEWMLIANIPCTAIIPPRTGKRLLQFKISISSRNTTVELAHGTYNMIYDNHRLGYLDIEENTCLANTLASGLAVSFTDTRDKESSKHALDLIKKWTAANLPRDRQPGNLKYKYQQFLTAAVKHFKQVENQRIRRICKAINAAASFNNKCEILMLCMSVISESTCITPRQTEMLKNTAYFLGIENKRLRAMIEDIRPFAMYEVKDLEICLGISSKMDDLQIRHQLSSEYRKWNSRIINTSEEIRMEAENMLNLIGETKQKLSV